MPKKDERSPILLNQELYGERERSIVERYLKGLSVPEIILETGFPPVIVKMTIKTLGLQKLVEERNAEATKKLLMEKVPVLEKILGASLKAVETWVSDLTDTEVLNSKLKTVQDVRCLTAIVTELNSVLRLELGQPTEHVKHDATLTLDEVKKVFKDLSHIDKVFDYPIEEDGQITNS